MIKILTNLAFPSLNSIDLLRGWSIAILLTGFDLTTLGIPCVANELSLVAKSLPPIAGKIRNPGLLKIQGTYCDLHLLKDPRKSDIFLSAYQSSLKSTALMNIDGKDTILTSIQEVKTKQGSIATYRSGNLNIRVTYIRTSPDYEGASYDATILVSRGNQRKIYRVKGACGI